MRPQKKKKKKKKKKFSLLQGMLRGVWFCYVLSSSSLPWLNERDLFFLWLCSVPCVFSLTYPQSSHLKFN